VCSRLTIVREEKHGEVPDNVSGLKSANAGGISKTNVWCTGLYCLQEGCDDNSRLSRRSVLSNTMELSRLVRARE
jgi:hypothetical protein